MTNESFDIGNIRFKTEMKNDIEIISPFHHRELGEKNETTGLYPKSVKWADIVINNVPLEKTYEYDDKFSDIRVPFNNIPEGEIMINERILSVKPDLRDSWRAMIGVFLLLISIFFANQVGLIGLIAKGYGALTWGYWIIFVIPVVTIGLKKILRDE